MPDGDITTWKVRMRVMPEAVGAPLSVIRNVAFSLEFVVKYFGSNA